MCRIILIIIQFVYCVLTWYLSAGRPSNQRVDLYTYTFCGLWLIFKEFSVHLCIHDLVESNKIKIKPSPSPIILKDQDDKEVIQLMQPNVLKSS